MKDVLKFTRDISLIVFIFLVVDQIVLRPLLETFVKPKYLSGDYQKIEYLFNESKEDIVFVGSSFAACSFIPRYIEDSTRCSVFNVGCSSQNVFFFHCILSELLSRHAPKMVVLVLAPEEIVIHDYGRLYMLNPYYDKNQVIKQTIDSESREKKYLMNIYSYRYNTLWMRLLLTAMTHVKDDALKYDGYEKHDKPSMLPIRQDKTDVVSLDSVNVGKREVLLSMIDMLQKQNVKVVMALTPKYADYPECFFALEALADIAKEKNIPLINHTNYFEEQPELFYDWSHLNYEGAKSYSSTFAGLLKQFLERSVLEFKYIE